MKAMVIVVLIFSFLVIEAKDNKVLSDEIDLSLSLVGYYKFDENSAKDYSGNNNNAVIVNNLQFRDTQFGRTPFFEGSDDANQNSGWVRLPGFRFEDWDEFTIALWVYEEGMTREDGSAYIAWGDGAHTGWLGIWNHWSRPRLNFRNHIQVGVGVDWSQTDNPNLLPLVFEFDQNEYRDKWIHHTLIYKNNELRYYRNGQFLGSKEQKVRIRGDFGALGHHRWNDQTVTATRFIGMMDEVRIYNRALTDDEIDVVANPDPDPDPTPSNCSLGFDYDADFLNKEFREFGSAKVQNKMISMTNNEPFQSGSVWTLSNYPLANGFNAGFTFSTADGHNHSPIEKSVPGGDGFAMVFGTATQYIPRAAGAMLGIEGIMRCMAIEVDLFQNFYDNAHDPDGNHIAVFAHTEAMTTDHNSDRMILSTSHIPIIEHNHKYRVELDFDGDREILIVKFGNDTIEDLPVVMTINDFSLNNLVGFIGNAPAYVALTATTGASFQKQFIHKWWFCAKE